MRNRPLRIESLEPRQLLAADPLITEFMASNNATLADGDGNYPDWIEVHNPTDSSIDLSGWHLTDDAANPTKWSFPSLTQSVLAPGEYLLVFASSQEGNDYVDADGYLHTNFALSVSGEYLALTDPVGGVVHEFAPEYPEQLIDVSYGISQANTVLLQGDSPGRYLVPPDDSLANTWTTPAFDDSLWTPSTLGIGYETNPTSGGTGDLINLALNGITSQSSQLSSFESDRAIDGDLTNFTHTAAGQDLPATWQVDLGDAYALEQIVLHNRDGCCFSRLRDITVEVLDETDAVIFTSDLLNPENILGGGVVFAGPETLEVDLVALTGGSLLGQTVRVIRTPDPDLSGTAGNGNHDEADVLSLGEVQVFGRETVSYDQLFPTNLQTDMFGVNSSVYLRSTFEYDSQTTPLEALLLNVQYDDGFVAYLNGVKIAERNAPAELGYDATATAERNDVQAIRFESINLTSYLNLLVDGENVLALQGLNLSAGDDDFLLVPELKGIATTSAERYFDVPTPGSANNEGVLGRVADTAFSVDRGFYDAPFQVEITSPTPAASIYYTTNGEVPTPTTGLLYTSPLTISQTTVLRAAAFKTDYIATNVDTQTYLFVDDIVSQDYQATLDAGLPTNWGGVSPDYGLDPDVIGDFDEQGNSLGGDNYGGIYADSIKSDLVSIPTLSIVMSTDDLFGDDGIYTNSTAGGVAWERATSVELINPDGSEGFQVDAGIRIQGGYFRSHSATKKHSFRLLFKDEYGPTTLNFPLFTNDGAVDEYNTIVLRAGANDGYSWNAARYTEQFTRDEFGRLLQNDLGHPSAHGNFVHLYINGIYWGLYNPVERPDNEFAASYLTGDADNWDAIHVGDAQTGDFQAWDAMLALSDDAGSSLSAFYELQGKGVDGSIDESIAPLLNVESYIDYIMLNVWGGNWDWPFKNFWAGRDRDPATTTGFEFFSWDFENTMGNNRSRSPLYATTLDQDFTGSRNAGQPHTNLKSSLEYRMFFADQIHEAFFNDGVLTPDYLIDRYQQLADQVEQSIVAESARWGDAIFGTPLTQDDWLAERDWILETYLPQRSAIVLQEFRNYGLYPSIDAPVFSQHGGQVVSGYDLSITASAGSIYYTLDGSDPRQPGGAISPSAILYTGQPIEVTSTSQVQARVVQGGNWSALNSALFTVDTLANATNLRITELQYNPAPPTTAEANAGWVDNEEFEFIELLNTSDQTIDLHGVTLSGGVDFHFDSSTPLAPGERVVLVENEAAFQTRYGITARIVGQWTGRLSNGGETLTLLDYQSELIQSFTYQDGDDPGEEAWPTAPDGNGPSLVIIDLQGDYNDGANWTTSTAANGTPGADDTPVLPGDYNLDLMVDMADYQVWKSSIGQTLAAGTGADGNGDGLVSLADYTVWRDHLGTSQPTISSLAATNFSDSAASSTTVPTTPTTPTTQPADASVDQVAETPIDDSEEPATAPAADRAFQDIGSPNTARPLSFMVVQTASRQLSASHSRSLPTASTASESALRPQVATGLLATNTEQSTEVHHPLLKQPRKQDDQHLVREQAFSDFDTLADRTERSLPNLR
ncbi:lamin tail domain-containing protein [Aeoliella mucimassa]|uniref:CotH protein n=1 Tax=Aeoliella mucimassa TaxID=2527972 RepID=A0A518AQG6_9BACT|nr:lamin tail domain-containing protein [Aeoliella mucimassa]QDU56968.1 CotH protein [Aeoliella mucimassa]